jgi:D-sedoheptulose 7-phosphate isomerase
MKGITEYLTQLQQILGRLPLDDIQLVIEALLAGHKAGAKVFIMGNGGSAATASHFACDLVKGTITAGMPRFRVIALTDNVPLMTAWANDMSYGDVFVEQLHGLLELGDVVIAISGSGNSENVVRAVRMAKWRGARTISLTGCGGGKLAPLTDVSVVVPSSCMEQIEDAHLILEHLICTTLRQELRKQARLLGSKWQEIKVEHIMEGEGQLPFDRAQDRPLSMEDDSAAVPTPDSSTSRLRPPKSKPTEVWTVVGENPAPRWKPKLEKGV